MDFIFGNENVHDVPQQVIDAGREIMENGVKSGFFGVGFDLLLDKTMMFCHRFKL